MAFKPLDWYCRPVSNGIWSREVENAFGDYTPCVTDSLVVGISHLVLLTLCFYRIWLIKKSFKLQRFCLKSKGFNYFLGILASYCAAEPLFRLVMGISILNVDGQLGLAPCEAVSLGIQAVSWFLMVIMIGLETKVYIREFRWYVRFGVAYTLVGDAVVLNLILQLKNYNERSVLYLYLREVAVQIVGYTLIIAPSDDNNEYFQEGRMFVLRGMSTSFRVNTYQS